MKLAIALIVVLLLTGCSSTQFTAKDGTTVSNTRLLMSTSNIEAHVGDNWVKVGASAPDMATIAAVLQYLATLQATNPTPTTTTTR